MTGVRVVAISRSIGAQGEQVGSDVARRLGFRYVDEEIIVAAAEKEGVDTAAIADAERRKSLLLRLLEGLGEGGATAAMPGGPTWIADDPLELMKHHDFPILIHEAIDETAAKGDVVIVAHGASFALPGREDVLRVFVTAPSQTRAKRLAEARGLDASAAAKEVKRSDSARADFLKRFYGVDREGPTHYDLVVNTAALGPDRATDVIVHAAGG